MVEGSFPKSDGEILYASEINIIKEDKDSVIYNLINNMKGQSAVNLLTYFSNGSLDKINMIGDGFATETFKSSISNLTYYNPQLYAEASINSHTAKTCVFTSTTRKVGTTINYAYPFVLWYGYKDLDDFQDSSISGSWTTAITGTGTITETEGYLRLRANGGPGGTSRAYYSGKNYYNTRSRVCIGCQLSHYETGGVTNIIRITDGTTNVNLTSLPTGPNPLDPGVYIPLEIQFNGSDNTCSYRYYNSLNKTWVGWTTISLTTLTSNWYIDVWLSVSHADSVLYNIIYVYWLADNTQTLSTTCKIELAANEINYKELSNITEITNIGTTPKVKITFTKAVNEEIFFSGYGVWFT